MVEQSGQAADGAFDVAAAAKYLDDLTSGYATYDDYQAAKRWRDNNTIVTSAFQAACARIRELEETERRLRERETVLIKATTDLVEHLGYEGHHGEPCRWGHPDDGCDACKAVDRAEKLI